MQRLCFTGAQLLDKDLHETDDKEQRARVSTGLANLMKTWTALQDSVRVLKGDPMPGSLKPDKPEKKRTPKYCWDAPSPPPGTH